MVCQTWLARETESAIFFTLNILTSFTVLFVEAVCELIGLDGVLLFSVGCYLDCICFASGLHLVQHCQVTYSDTLSSVNHCKLRISATEARSEHKEDRNSNENRCKFVAVAPNRGVVTTQRATRQVVTLPSHTSAID